MHPRSKLTNTNNSEPRTTSRQPHTNYNGHACACASICIEHHPQNLIFPHNWYNHVPSKYAITIQFVLYNIPCTDIQRMTWIAWELTLPCTLQNSNYWVPFVLALVLLAIGVQIIVFLVFTWRPGRLLWTVNLTHGIWRVSPGPEDSESELTLCSSAQQWGGNRLRTYSVAGVFFSLH